MGRAGCSKQIPCLCRTPCPCGTRGYPPPEPAARPLSGRVCRRAHKFRWGIPTGPLRVWWGYRGPLCKVSCRRRSAPWWGEAGGVRDPLLNEAIRRLAAEAATRFSTLVAGGEQIPFDVAESAGPDEAFFHSYVPLTARFVREREAELRSLPAFEPARDAVDAAGVAAPYLEQRGESVPAEPGGVD